MARKSYASCMPRAISTTWFSGDSDGAIRFRYCTLPALRECSALPLQVGTGGGFPRVVEVGRCVDAGASEELGQHTAAAGAINDVGHDGVLAADGLGVGGIGCALGRQDGQVQVEQEREIGV